ncbi:MAG: polyphosphate polymerase domain-containing protein [Chloroflexota bacterium]|nr:polyphosphate polymerase domain-containing protein [Chloroflexota bacterium]
MQLNNTLPAEDSNINWRFETKYRISYPQYFAIKNAIAPYLKTDLFTQSASEKRYLVRSLYFDTWDYKNFIEKINGDCNRMKFRIRTYGTDPMNYPDIRVEIKVRTGNIIKKYGSFINYEQHLWFMKSRYWNPCDDPVLIEFERYVHKWNLIPVTLVQYFREGFHSRAQEGIRLTFDHLIKSASSNELFPACSFWHRHNRSQIVLEIKHQNKVPFWLNELIQQFNLKVVSNSKYTNSIEIAERRMI